MRGGERGEELRHALAEVAERLTAVTVQVRAGGRGLGSGVVWRRDGLIVTNAHVATSERLEVVASDGAAYSARLLARDARRDLAALALGVEVHVLPAPRTDARALRPGELLLALGHPLGVPNALALGVVYRGPSGARGSLPFVLADIRLAPGNSGGPLADALGRVVGINAMIAGGLGLAVPTHLVERFVAEQVPVGGVRAA